MDNSPITIFTNTEFGNVRTHTDENGTPWFVARDVAGILQSASMAATWLSVMTNRLMISSLVPWLMPRALWARERIYRRSSTDRYKPYESHKRKTSVAETNGAVPLA